MVYALHAVIINKDLGLEEAKKISQDIIKDKKKTFYRETTDSFRFRNISKQKFKKGSFKTKIVNKDISLIFGDLISEYSHLK